MRVGDLVMFTYEDGEPVVARILGGTYGEELRGDAYVTCEVVWAAVRPPLREGESEKKGKQLLGQTTQWPMYRLRCLDPVWLGLMYTMTMNVINEVGMNHEAIT